MISLSEVRARSARENKSSNLKLYFLGNRVSIYFSWIFINLGMSANDVTLLFFIVGFAGALAMFRYSPSYAVIGYLGWRLHYIFDICDGEVARFNKKFSLNGTYWDCMIHAVLFPLFFLGMIVSVYIETHDPKFLFLTGPAVLVSSLMLSVKNNYYRAMLANNVPIAVQKQKVNAQRRSGFLYFLFHWGTDLLSFEGLLAFHVLFCFLKQTEWAFWMYAFYILTLGGVALVKFFFLSKKGFVPSRA